MISCVGGADVHFSPGLTLHTQHSRITGTATYTCTGIDPRSHPTSARSIIKGAGETSCLGIASTAVEEITWNTGEHSKVLYERHNLVQPVSGETVAAVDGRVVEGKYKGRTVASPGAQLTLRPLDCASPQGVDTINGPTTLVIT
ncbi:hypothetical protein GCM10010218_30210 [Streptomyces mashuensis]|uniref:Uncharacterized protein n=1 Tax=Streptomyces mashuensis TaxID=33904 RepID=A0A919ED74_9ACTN|nr:hypothetical protein [Streptomyces mashuensis]GHF46883.1 hypothetical protein GCM10010218_30210 [Streptomyces mashuensis]